MFVSASVFVFADGLPFSWTLSSLCLCMHCNVYMSVTWHGQIETLKHLIWQLWYPLCVFFTGHSKQASSWEERNWRPDAPSWSCSLGCRLSVWAHTQREPDYQWCSKRNIIASQHGILTLFFFFFPPFSCFHVALVLLKPFIPHCHPSPSLSFLHFIIPFFNFSLGLISFHPTSSCLLSLFHVPLYFLTLIFPPRSSLSLSLTWRHASEVFFQKRKKRKEKNDPVLPVRLLPDQTCGLCSSPGSPELY